MSDFKKKYDFIISLGRFCHTAAILNNNKLKIVAGPWDWSGTAHTEVIYKRIRCLYKGFNGWFNKKDFVDFEPYKQELYQDFYDDAPKPLNSNPSAPSHHIKGKSEIIREYQYYNKKTKTYYAHDFKSYPSFEEQFKGIRDKYMRRFMRTLNFIKSSNSILLVYINNMADQRRNLPLNTQKVLAAMNKLRKHYPDKTIDLYMFDHDTAFHGENFQRIIHDVGIIRYVSNHYDVYPVTDTDSRHIADNLMMPISICYILSKLELTDKNKMI